MELVAEPIATMSDSELLQRHAYARDRSAFEQLTHRHGPMVRAVCRRILGNNADADDAVQAVLLVLARKSAMLRQTNRLGPWLHTVAVRAASRHRTAIQRRLEHERPVHPLPETSHFDEPEINDWLPVLDEAIRDLPERLRTPLVMCELEGKPRGQVARSLGIPEGTLSSRLARGRDLLRKRLSRTGALVTGVGLTTAFLTGSNALSAAEQALFTRGALTGTVPAHVATLSSGVLKTMLNVKLKMSAMVIMTLGMLGGVLLGGWNALSQAGEDKGDAKAIQGKWAIVSISRGGEEPKGDEAKKILENKFEFKGDKMIAKAPATFSLDEAKTPKEIDWKVTEGPERERGTWKGIYELKGDSLTICVAMPDQDRPSRMESKAGSAAMLIRLKKAK